MNEDAEFCEQVELYLPPPFESPSEPTMASNYTGTGLALSAFGTLWDRFAEGNPPEGRGIV